MKLQVRNNWENLEWTLDGKSIKPGQVQSIELAGEKFDTRSRRYRTSVNDMGNIYRVDTTDIDIKIVVAGVDVWVSLSKNPNLLKEISHVTALPDLEPSPAEHNQD